MKLSIEEEEAFRALMISVQSASNGTLPHSIVHFMEQTLSISTKTELLKRVGEKKLTVSQIASAMIAAGDAVDYGSIEPVDDFIKRKLL